MVRISVFVVLICYGFVSLASAQTLQTLGTFDGSSGGEPFGVLISGSTLYGATEYGGSGYGTIFSLPVSGGTPTAIASFNRMNGETPQCPLLLVGGNLYGTAGNGNFGEVFSVPVGGGTPSPLVTFNQFNGQAPTAGLVISGNTLYGTTPNGGPNDIGEVFSVLLSGGTPSIVTGFNISANGAYPNSGVVLSNGTLYGTTSQGGTNNGGVVYSVPLGGGTPSVLASFTPSGQGPSDVIVSADGTTLYGVTHTGGSQNDGVVFSLPVSGGTPTILGTFNGANGTSPRNLVLSPDGTMLYGLTASGGPGASGDVFSLPAAGGTPNVLAYFNSVDGYQPDGLTISPDGSTLYGTTGGSQPGGGTVFAVALAPEPTSLALLALTMLGLFLRRVPRAKPVEPE